MTKIHVQTKDTKQIIDITDRLQEEIDRTKKHEGILTVFVMHTTAGITTADLDPGTDLDFLDALQIMMPKLSFRHPHNPVHTPDHIWSSIIGPSVTIPVVDGKLLLGIWQRVVLIEFDGPRERTIALDIR